MGGGDIKLAGATGLVLGLPASLTASCLGLTGFVTVSYTHLDVYKRQVDPNAMMYVLTNSN